MTKNEKAAMLTELKVAMHSFALCKRCRDHLCKLMKGGEKDGR